MRFNIHGTSCWAFQLHREASLSSLAKGLDRRDFYGFHRRNQAKPAGFIAPNWVANVEREIEFRLLES